MIGAGAGGLSWIAHTPSPSTRASLGAPAPGIDVLSDPLAADVEPCCYVVFVRLYDRAIVDNRWNGGHIYDNWRSVTVA